MKKFFIALFIALSGIVVAQTIPNFTGTINSTFPDNTSGQITPANVRAFEQALVNLFGTKLDYPFISGTTTPGDCVKIAANGTQIQDAGATCAGANSPGGSNLQVQYNNLGSFGGYTNTQLTALINPCTSALSGAVPAGGGNTGLFLNGNCAFSAPTGTGVTSVGLSVPTGFAVSGSPITTSGTIALTLSGTLPTSSIPCGTASTLGGVETGTAPSNQWVTGINGSCALTFAQPSFSNLSGNISTGQMNNGTGASSTTVFFGDNTWRTPAGGGTVTTSGAMVSGDCIKSDGGTVISDAGSPCGAGGGGTNLGYINIQTYGAIGDGTCHPLSGTYANLAAAQAVYPFVSDLTQCTDWAAIQQAVNVSFNSAPAGLFGPGYLPVYCPAGNFELSNPIILDIPNNSSGTDAAWLTGTTYANAAFVKYNGIRWQSAGSGNIGNPPTAYNAFPSTIQPVGGGDYPAGFPWAAVQISNASPAVITPLLAGGSINVVANQPIVFFTQHYANPNGGSTPSLPTGINANQVYYVVGASITGTTFEVSTTPSGSAVNTSSAGVGNFFISGQVWQFAPTGSGTTFSSQITLLGAEGMSENTGCTIQTRANWTSPAILVGPQNGVLVKNVAIYGQVPGGSVNSPGSNGYRCTAPASLGGPAQTSQGQVMPIGLAVMSNGGGATRTKFENITVGGFYTNDYHSYGTVGEIVDHNTWINAHYQGGCIGLYMISTQSFINTLIDPQIGMSTTGIIANAQEGVTVKGGDFSTFDALSVKFTISSVSTASGCGFLCVVATISSPDNNFQLPMCAYDAGEAFNAGAEWLNAYPFAAGCGYNTFIIPTAQWGYIGMYIMNYNPFTGVATFGIPKAFSAIYQGACCGSNLTSEITGATTLYAVEVPLKFYGDNQVDTIHIEDDGVPFSISCFCTTFFGGIRPAELKNVYLNAEASLGSVACCNIPNPNKFTWRFYAQQVVPLINSSSGDTILDYAPIGGGNTQVQGGGFGNDMDRLLLATGVGNYIEARHTLGTSIGNGQSTGSDWNAQMPLFDFYPREEYAVPLVGTTQGQLSGGYVAYGGQAYGSGIWDNGAALGPYSEFSLNASGQPTDMANMWRTRGWGQAPQWGVRPAPWTTPCILPSQASSLASLPAISFVSTLHDYVQVASGGSGYMVGDTITLAGGTGTAAQLTVNTVSSGVITSVRVSVVGAYTAEPASTFTQGSTSGSGTGATFTATGPIWMVNYNIGYPMLWGGHIYKACNYNDASFASSKYAIKSSHLGWSYFQNLTTTNVPHLAWTMDGTSPFIYLNWEALELMFPGLVFSLTGSGSCSGTESFIVLEVHPTLGYVKTIRADNDGSNLVPALAASGTTCTGTTIGQASPTLVFPY